MKTNASVSWTPAAWNTVGEAGAAQRTADLTAVVQEIVSETGWSSGNAMAFIFTGSGKRVAEAYDGDAAGAPMLYVEYTVGSNTVDTVADTTAPVITLNGTDAMTLNVGDTFSDPGATATDDVDGDITSAITTDANVDTSVAGSYLVTYTVSDSSGNSATAERSVIVNDGNAETLILQSRVASSEDDAEELADGNVYPASSDLELILDKTEQTVGIRFTNLNIPENATITKAYIQFQVDEASADSAAFSIYGESTDNAPIFTATAGNISDRMKTNASVTWSPAAWSTVGEAGAAQRTADLTAVVQEIVSETGWSSGNAMAFIFTGSGKRVAEAYDGDAAGAPQLYVEYTVAQ